MNGATDRNRLACPLELDGESFQRLVAQTTARLADFLDQLPHQPAANLRDAVPLARAVCQPVPEVGRPYDEILAQLFEQVFPVALNTTGPGYLAYIPGGGLPHAAIADLMALITNRYPGLWSAAPVVAAVEAVVIRWFCEMVGYPSSSGGFLTSGGSLANWSALVVARDTRLPDHFREGTLYTSTQAHHSIDKAMVMAGLDRRHLRRIPVDDQWRVRVDVLREQLQADRRAGLKPLAIVAHAGTTNTGAVDDLSSLADLAEKERVWLHVDAAYGGFFLLTARGRAALQGIARADSITLDPHKGLFLPYGTGSLLVRDAALLPTVFAHRGAYMAAEAPSPEFLDFCDISPELSRDFRALRVWLPIQMQGINAFRDCLQEKLELADLLATALADIPAVETVARSPLSILAFRLRRPEWDDAICDERTRQLLEQVNASGRVWLTSTQLDGRLVIRVCILSFRTHRDRIEELVELIRRAVPGTEY